jgi:hypothetical protein
MRDPTNKFRLHEYILLNKSNEITNAGYLHFPKRMRKIGVRKQKKTRGYLEKKNT